jgi:hypothetical protein
VRIVSLFHRVPCTVRPEPLCYLCSNLQLLLRPGPNGPSAEMGTIMERKDQERTRNWAARAGEARITLLKNNDRRCSDFEAFLEDFTLIAPHIKLETEMVDPSDPPGMMLSENLIYHAVPSGLELAPFLDALSLAGQRPPALDDATRHQVEAVTLPADLRVFMGMRCHHCPGVIARLTPLAVSNRNIRIDIIDCALFPEEAKAENVQAVPTVVLDDGFRWTGQLRIEEILDVLIHRDPGALAPSTLERMLKEGDAGRLATMMLEKGEVFAAFLGLLVSKSWPVRMGAMVVMEELAEKDPTLAHQTAEPLWEKFDEADDAIKGDLLYVFGEVKCADLLPRIRKILTGPFAPDVREAAAEAIEKITGCNPQ